MNRTPPSKPTKPHAAGRRGAFFFAATLSIAAAVIGLFCVVEQAMALWFPGAGRVELCVLVVALLLFAGVMGYLLLKRHFIRAERLVTEVGRRREAENQLETLFRLSQDMLCIAGSDGYFKRINPAFTESLGYSAEVLLSRSLVDFVDPLDRDGTRAALAELARGQRVVDFVNRYRCADGTRRWLQWRATPYAENQRTIAVARDITVARQREAALRDSEKRYRLLVENMSDGVAVYDGVGDGQDFVFLDVNKAGERIGGIAKHSVIGRSVRDIFPAVVEMGLFDIFQRVWRTGIPQRHEASRYQDERLSLWVENYVFKLPGGQIVSVFKDLTGMKQKEEQLVASELLFRTLFEKAPIGMNVVAADGTPARVNLALQRLLGYSEAEFCREHFRAWTHPDDVTSSLDLVERLRRGEADSLSIDKRYLRKDGGTVWAHTSVAAVRNANGDIDYFITMIEDVTERRGREEQARRLTDENRHLPRRLLRIQEDERESIARELHDEIGQSITGIRADVQAIDAYCRRMPPGPDRDGVEASVNAIEQVAQRLYESAHSLMRQLHPSLLDDLGLRAGLEDMLQTWCDRHPGIRCQVEITDQLGRIAKPVALVLFRIVQEALTNIAKHAAANAISVRLTLRPESRDDAHSVYLQITDDGRGFDASQPTLGIGLAGMRERVLTKGGTLAVDTSPGQGVVIRVRIPVADGRKPI